MPTTKGTPDNLLGTAPIFDVEPQGEETALFAFIVPTLNIPINIPVAVRTGGDYGLRFTVSEHHPAHPAGRSQSDLLGLSRRVKPRRRTLSQRALRRTGELPRLCGHGLPRKADHPRAFRCIRSPTTRPPAPARRLTDHLEVQTYQDPEHLSRTESEYPATTGCDHEVFNPVLYASPTTAKPTRPRASTSN